MLSAFLVLFSINTKRYPCALLKVTPTMHGSLLRVKFPEYYAGVTDNIFNQTRRLMIALDNV
jgi:hypothetical protein